MNRRRAPGWCLLLTLCAGAGAVLAAAPQPAAVLPDNLSLDEALQRAERELKADPRAPALRPVLRAVQAKLGNTQQGEALLVLVLAARQADLQVLCAKPLLPRLARNEALALQLFKECEPAALAELTAGGLPWYRHLASVRQTVQARLLELSAAADPAVRQMGLVGCGKWLVSGSVGAGADAVDARFLAVTLDYVRSSIAGAVHETEAAVPVLNALVQRQMNAAGKRPGLSPELAQLCVQALARDDLALRGVLAELLAGLITLNARGPLPKELNEAVAPLVSPWLEKAPPEQQVSLATALLRSSDLRGQTHLVKLLNDTALVPQLRSRVVNELGARMDLASPQAVESFVVHLLDEKENRALRATLFNMLASSSPGAEALAGALPKLAASLTFPLGTAEAARLKFMVSRARQTSQPEQPAPAPSWCAGVSAVARQRGQDAKRPQNERKAWLELYAAAGAQEDTDLERAILDQTAAPALRLDALRGLAPNSATTTVFEKVLPVFSQQPVEIRAALELAAARSPKAPKSLELVCAALRDDELRPQRGVLLAAVDLESTPETIATLTAIALDDATGADGRGQAAAWIARKVDDTALFAQLLESYAQQPEALRVQLASAAGLSRQAPKAAEYVSKALRDARLGTQRIQILRHARVAPTPELVDAFVELLLDSQQESELRHTAALALQREQVAQCDTNAIARILPEYSKLDTDERFAAAALAAVALNAPKAADLFVLALRDTTLANRRAGLLWRVKLPLSESLLAALRELQQDSVCRDAAREALRRLQQKK